MEKQSTKPDGQHLQAVIKGGAACADGFSRIRGRCRIHTLIKTNFTYFYMMLTMAMMMACALCLSTGSPFRHCVSKLHLLPVTSSSSAFTVEIVELLAMNCTYPLLPMQYDTVPCITFFAASTSHMLESLYNSFQGSLAKKNHLGPQLQSDMKAKTYTHFFLIGMAQVILGLYGNAGYS